MKITILTEYFAPENGAAARRMATLANYLSKENKVTVITSQPTYMLSAEKAVQDIGDLLVHRVFKQTKGRPNNFLRALNEFHFSLKVLFLMTRLSKPDHLLVTSPTPFLTIAALMMKWVHGVSYSLDIRDLYPQTIVEAGLVNINEYMSNLINRYMRLVYRYANQVYVVNQNWIGEDIEHEHLQYFPNGIDNNENPLDWNERQNSVAYVGNFGKLYDFDLILRIAKACKKSNQPELRDLRFKLIGAGVQEVFIQQTIQAEQLENVELIPPVSSSEIPRILKEIKIGIIALKQQVPTLIGSIPNKIYDYLAQSMAIISVMGEPLAEELQRVGEVHNFDGDDLKPILDRITKLLSLRSMRRVNPDEHPYLYRSYHFNKVLSEMTQRVP